MPRPVLTKCSASASVYLLYWYKSTGFTSTKVQILTQRCYIPAGIKFVCFRQSQACVERMIDAVLDALNKASGSTTTPPEAAANLADMLAGLLLCASSCCCMLYVSSYCYMCPYTIYAANLGDMSRYICRESRGRSRYMCPHTAICVIILLYVCPYTIHTRTHTCRSGGVVSVHVSPALLGSRLCDICARARLRHALHRLHVERGE